MPTDSNSLRTFRPKIPSTFCPRVLARSRRSITKISQFFGSNDPIRKKAVAVMPLPEKPDPFAVATAFFELSRFTTTSLGLTMVSFDPVSTTITAGFPLISALININPKVLLYSNGTSTEYCGCGTAPKPRAPARTTATVNRLRQFTSTDSPNYLDFWRRVDALFIGIGNQTRRVKTHR